MKASRTVFALSILPSLFMVALFYSLALHMRYTLGAWPMSIGDRGFSSALSTHGQMTWNYCGALLFASMVALPLGMLMCLLVRRWKRYMPYFGWYALFYVSCWGVMLLAPAPFLTWWWD